MQSKGQSKQHFHNATAFLAITIGVHNANDALLVKAAEEGVVQQMIERLICYVED